MESKPVITYAGDLNLFASLQSTLEKRLSEETVEWRRSYGRSPKMVKVEADFVPFNEDIIPQEGEWNISGHPLLHTYWTECSNLESYKSTSREEINAWFSYLKLKNVHDWMIVVVDHADIRKANKAKLLPRTTVLDKVKNDFPSKNSERCISLLDPLKNDSRSRESWQSFLHRVRILVLQAYNYHLGRYEEYVRTQRERRNEPGWTFNRFFFLQEELAFVFEMLGLYEEALVQYDELDALFSQFVINSNVGGMPEWLTQFCKPCDTWPGLCLLKSQALLEKLREGKSSLLDFRNYLFSRQCSLLLLRLKPWELAQRALPFLHNCVKELKVLEIVMPPGSIACWVFLSCLEVLQTCEIFKESSQVEACSLYTAGLRSYAREKLHELGILCGLMPDMEATSEQLHLVVSLLSRIGNDPHAEKAPHSPHAKLCESLSSKEAFLKNYLEMSELTISTFKYIGQVRNARLIGYDLAQLYLKLKEPHKAVTFLLDMLKTYQQEGWEKLQAKTEAELAACYKAMGNTRSYIKFCAYLSASSSVVQEEKEHYFRELITLKKMIEKDVYLRSYKLLFITDVKIQNSEVIIPGSKIQASVKISNLFPEEITCNSVSVSVVKLEESTVQKGHVRTTSGSEDSIPLPESSPDLIHHHDGNTGTARIHCFNVSQVLQRRDSHHSFHQDSSKITKDECEIAFYCQNLRLKPGDNLVTLNVQIHNEGVYSLKQVSVEWGKLWFIQNHIIPQVTFHVLHEPCKMDLHQNRGELLAGVPQNLEINVNSGSNHVPPGTEVILKSSRGLLLSLDPSVEDFSDEIKVVLAGIKPFQTIKVTLHVLAHLGPQRDNNTVEHQINLKWLYLDQCVTIPLHFLPPFMSINKLHTCEKRKYVQIIVHGLTSESFILVNSSLKSIDSKQVHPKPLSLSNGTLIVNTEQTAGFLWELRPEECALSPIKFIFSVDYLPKHSDQSMVRKYTYDFRLDSHKTLYVVKAQVIPAKGLEFCRVGSMCNMHLSIIQFQSVTPNESLMYEIVVDQSQWAVCGRTAGVVNVDMTGKHNVTLEVMPLIGGFLPQPVVRLSRYIPADHQKHFGKDSGLRSEGNGHSAARLEPFKLGQVYNYNRATQVHVLPATATSGIEVVAT
ncbi:trafficking protein particle complex subunit 10-like [Limulus polyphemus]|uniref:Trafficking protein particle complex subunit 10-like n=1 Tax=Limulus polyphemus TaxID=6850 RepID=A0ABM1SEN9_LIMPO|nr:trafficking protein particle complex subunit 10-like [Limulus polyphemus]